MHSKKFHEVLGETIDKCKSVLIKKADEYAEGEDDRLHNFRKAANLQGETMEQALGGMMAKHVVSIFDMIESGEQYTIEQWDEKIVDNLNYLFLLKAIVIERAESPASPLERLADHFRLEDNQQGFVKVEGDKIVPLDPSAQPGPRAIDPDYKPRPL